jgi:predicted Zn-dependent protease
MDAMPIRVAVVVLVMASLAALAGCKGPRLISTEQEISIGRDVAENVRSEYGVDSDPAKNARVRGIGERLVAVCSRPDLPYTFEVLDTDDVNAFAVMGGPVFVTNGLMNAVGSDDGQLASVIGHEIAHITRRHGVRQLEKALGLSVIVSLLTSGKSEDAETVARVASNLAMQGWSRDDEKDADLVGVDYAVAARFDGWGLVRFLEKLMREQGNQSKFEVYLSSHPSYENRINRISDHLRKKGIERPQ